MWIGSPLRGALRLVSYFLLTCLMVPVYLLATALRIRPIIRWMPLLYHRTVCFILGIRVHVHGKRSDVTPTLYVCNHISYLDIEVLGSRVPGSFVAKAEVATWPFFNVLARAQRTIFIERRSGKTSASRDQMMKRLDTGDNLMLFPEGTSSDGTRVLPFRTALFGVAQLRRDALQLDHAGGAVAGQKRTVGTVGGIKVGMLARFGQLGQHQRRRPCLQPRQAFGIRTGLAQQLGEGRAQRGIDAPFPFDPGQAQPQQKLNDRVVEAHDSSKHVGNESSIGTATKLFVFGQSPARDEVSEIRRKMRRHSRLGRKRH